MASTAITGVKFNSEILRMIKDANLQIVQNIIPSKHLYKFGRNHFINAHKLCRVILLDRMRRS